MEEQTDTTTGQPAADPAAGQPEGTQAPPEGEAAGEALDPGAAAPLDPSLDPAAVDGLDGSLQQSWELLQAGGPVVAILLVLSVVAMAIVLAKLWQFRAARLGDLRAPRQALTLYRGGRVSEALALASRSRNPVARVLVRAINGRTRRDLSEALVREEVVRYGGDLLEGLRGWFRPLEVIASLAPLLGLFGTVLGMISAFRQLEQAGSQVNPAILSGGIWEALLTTAVGLAVAMPVIVVLNWLERRVDCLAHEMDSLVTQVFTEDLSYALRAEENSHGPAEQRPAALAAGR